MSNTAEKLAHTIGIIWIAPFYLVGWIAGNLAKLARLTWAAVLEGYRSGNKL